MFSVTISYPLRQAASKDKSHAYGEGAAPTSFKQTILQNEVEGDVATIIDTISCPSFWDLFLGQVGYDGPLPDASCVLLLTYGNCELSCDIADLIFIGLHICFLCFNACRHGQILSERLVRHYTSHFSRTHFSVSRFLRRLSRSS